MTVTIRPVPSRVAGNRIVPFGRVQYTYKPNPVGLRDWKPPVPEPLQPAPLLGLGTLALLGLQALAWAWGQLNSRPKPAFEQVFQPIPGTVPPVGNTTPGTWTYRYGPITWQITNPDCSLYPTVFSAAGVPNGINKQNVISVSPVRYLSGACGVYRRELTIKYAGGLPDEVFSLGAVAETSAFRNYSGPESMSWNGPGAVPFVDEPPASPAPNGYVVPQVEPEPEPAVSPPAPLPLPLPATVPQVVPTTEPNTLPAPSPLVPVTPGPVAPPIVKPARPLMPNPPNLPAPTKTVSGTVVLPAPVPVPTTPQDAVFPVPGGLPVTGRTMTPTIQAVAQEVGRIEQKIDRMLNPDQGQWGSATDRLQLLWQLLSQLYNALTDGAPAGSYQLSSPCVTDENGDRVASEVEWDEQGTNHGAILARVDAIAALLQVHKDLKQPNCKGPEVPLAGEFVTVNFEQID